MPPETCLQAVSEQKRKTVRKSLEWRCAAGFRRLYPVDSSVHHPVFDSPVLFDGRCRRKTSTVSTVLNRLARITPNSAAPKSRLVLQAMLYPLVLLVVATGVVTTFC